MQPAPQIHRHDTLGSTNDEAARLLADPAAAAPLVVIARQQTAGRGRFGRPWHSEPNGNLYISFGFRPRVAPARLQLLTLWAGVNICDLLATRPHTKTAPRIKWPNDILYGPRKVAGLLAEARVAAGVIDTLVLGLGLNLNPPAAGWPPELAATATSLAEQTNAENNAENKTENSPGKLDPAAANALATALIARVLDTYDRLLANPAATAAALAALWQKYDHLRGTTITAISGNDRLTGIADGIDAEGSLILRTPNAPAGVGATTQKIRAGEVTIAKEATMTKEVTTPKNPPPKNLPPKNHALDTRG